MRQLSLLPAHPMLLASAAGLSGRRLSLGEQPAISEPGFVVWAVEAGWLR